MSDLVVGVGLACLILFVAALLIAALMSGQASYAVLAAFVVVLVIGLRRDPTAHQRGGNTGATRRTETGRDR